jgi:hypothetical protein
MKVALPYDTYSLKTLIGRISSINYTIKLFSFQWRRFQNDRI